MTAMVARKLLVVEDNAFDVKLVELLLSKNRDPVIEVEVATHLVQGLDRLRGGDIDALLLDLNLPDSKGLATFQTTHQAHPEIPIIILTGTNDDEISAEAMRQGAQDFLVKGMIDRHSLTRSIRYAVERQESHNKLRANEERYRNIFNASHDTIYVSALDGTLVEFNDAAIRLFGHPRKQLLGVRLRHLCVEPEQADRFETALTDRETVRDFELHLVTADKRTIECLVTAVARHDERGERCGYQGTIRDVTERKKLERELAQAQKLESIGRLAAGIAHEINTPIQYVSDNTRFLSDGFAKIRPLLEHHRSAASSEASEHGNGLSTDEADFLLEQIPGALEESLEGLDRVATIVRAMKEFSHPGTKDAQPLDVNKAIHSTITVSRNEWKHLADIVTDLDTQLPSVIGHVNQLNQVFLNIIVNAAHAIAEQGRSGKGTITITTAQSDDNVEIRIADDGPGIPDDVKAKIFEPFFTTKEVGKGTGQGLAVARSVIVDKHGGSMRVESTVDVGTTFVIQLPKTPVEELAHPTHIGA